MGKEEKVRFDAAVQQEVAKIMLAQQAQFSKAMETAVKDALKGVDQANAALAKERKAVEKELDAARALRAKAEKEGDKMAQAYFEHRQKQFAEAARTELLRNLTRLHLEVGKAPRDIAIWLDVPLDFVENIRQLLKRVAQYEGKQSKRLRLEGSPQLRYVDMGRGGTIWFENRITRFDMWWEFAGGDALVIVDIPTPEQWETRTKLPLEQRESTLTFIGEQIVEDKISGEGSFIIGERVLTFYAYKQA